jgi:hypothetical protein
MRSLLAIFLVACAAPRPFAPERVYVVVPWAREMTLSDSSITEDVTHTACSSPNIAPAIECREQTALRFDGCRWSCGPWFRPAAQPMRAVTLIVNGSSVDEALLSTNPCAAPNYCEGL